jgi:hypothetical protein
LSTLQLAVFTNNVKEVLATIEQAALERFNWWQNRDAWLKPWGSSTLWAVGWNAIVRCKGSRLRSRPGVGGRETLYRKLMTSPDVQRLLSGTGNAATGGGTMFGALVLCSAWQDWGRRKAMTDRRRRHGGCIM